MMVYLDNASTTRPNFFAKDYSNLWLNSNTGCAKNEQEALTECRKRIKDCLGVKSGYVLFCRCATEAVEWLMRQDCYLFNQGKWCSEYEHDSVDNCMLSLETDLLNEYNINFYFHQYVNQLTGKIFNIESIIKSIREYDELPDVYPLFGSDFTSAIGHAKRPANLDTYCDIIWASAHKWYGPKNQGFIWISDRLFECLGGSVDPRNNYGLLHGTLDVPGIKAMTEALIYTTTNLTKFLCHYRELTDYLFHYASFKGLAITEHIIDGSPAIHAITVPNVNADALQAYLSSKEIYVGVGHSACSEDSDYRVLDAFGYTKEQAEQTIRVSFCEDNTLKDIEELVDNIIEFKGKF